MRKAVNIILALVLVLTLVLFLAACGAKSDKGATGGSSISGTTSNTGSSTTIAPQKDQTSHYEYTHSALEGCVITQSDRLTGKCVYRTKCPVCGKTSSVINKAYLTADTMISGATCTNSQCTNWGKSFVVKIETTVQLVND